MMAKVLKCVGWGCQGPASRWRCSYSIAAELRDGGGGWGLLNPQVLFPEAGESYSIPMDGELDAGWYRCNSGSIALYWCV